MFFIDRRLSKELKIDIIIYRNYFHEKIIYLFIEVIPHNTKNPLYFHEKKHVSSVRDLQIFTNPPTPGRLARY